MFKKEVRFCCERAMSDEAIDCSGETTRPYLCSAQSVSHLRVTSVLVLGTTLVVTNGTGLGRNDTICITQVLQRNAPRWMLAQYSRCWRSARLRKA